MREPKCKKQHLICHFYYACPALARRLPGSCLDFSGSYLPQWEWRTAKVQKTASVTDFSTFDICFGARFPGACPALARRLPGACLDFSESYLPQWEWSTAIVQKPLSVTDICFGACPALTRRLPGACPELARRFPKLYWELLTPMRMEYSQSAKNCISHRCSPHKWDYKCGNLS
jgi:hypothetical protein